MTRPWLRALARKSRSGQPSPAPPAAGRRPGARLRLEAVEDRTLTSAVAAELAPPPLPAMVAPATAPGDPIPVADPAPSPLTVPVTPPPAAPAADATLPAVTPGPLSAAPAALPAGVIRGESKPPEAPATPTPAPLARVLEAPADGLKAADAAPAELPGPRVLKAEAPAQSDGPQPRHPTASTAISLSAGEPVAGRPAAPAARSDGPAAPGAPAAPRGATPADGRAAAPAAAPVGPAARAAGRVRAEGPGPIAPESNGRPTGLAATAAPPIDPRLSADLSDGALLGRFVTDRDQGAFAALVQRHGPLVLGVCRQVLGDWSAAQDAFQSTFLVLARKAGLLDRNSPLGGWLYKVAYRIALRSRTTSARQRVVETEAGTEWAAKGADDHAAADVEQAELRQVVREELDRLPEEYRAPLMLCYFDGRTHADAAREIGLPRGSMAKRIGEGLEQLRERLLVRGFMM